MALLNPIVSKFNLAAGAAQEVYVCPDTKSHAIIDINLFKDDVNNDSIVTIALASNSNPNNLTPIDYFIKNFKLLGPTNTAEVSKIVVGSGGHVFVKVISGPNVIARVSGIEENNPRVVKAGRLIAGAIAGTNQTEIYSNDISNVSYISSSMTLFNTSNTQDANIEGWISTSATPSISDKVFNINIPANETAVFENILLSPNERIFIKSSISGSEYFINGIVVSSN